MLTRTGNARFDPRQQPVVPCRTAGKIRSALHLTKSAEITSRDLHEKRSGRKIGLARSRTAYLRPVRPGPTNRCVLWEQQKFARHNLALVFKWCAGPRFSRAQRQKAVQLASNLVLRPCPPHMFINQCGGGKAIRLRRDGTAAKLEKMRRTTVPTQSEPTPARWRLIISGR